MLRFDSTKSSDKKAFEKYWRYRTAVRCPDFPRLQRFDSTKFSETTPYGLRCPYFLRMQRFDSGPKPVYLLNWLEVLKAQIETIETSAGPELFILKRLKLFPFFKCATLVKLSKKHAIFLQANFSIF